MLKKIKSALFFKVFTLGILCGVGIFPGSGVAADPIVHSSCHLQLLDFTGFYPSWIESLPGEDYRKAVQTLEPLLAAKGYTLFEFGENDFAEYREFCITHERSEIVTPEDFYRPLEGSLYLKLDLDLARGHLSTKPGGYLRSAAVKLSLERGIRIDSEERDLESPRRLQEIAKAGRVFLAEFNSHLEPRVVKAKNKRGRFFGFLSRGGVPFTANQMEAELVKEVDLESSVAEAVSELPDCLLSDV